MNKTININLGGMPFVIDDEAYYRLDDYLKALEQHFSKSEGFEEIIGDIEARIAEIFHKKLNGRNIVLVDDVAHTISVMGTPDDFGDMAEENYDASDHSHWQMNTGKRLFRDTDDKVIGGVCSGLAAYFGMDPVWVRIGFAVVFFTMGVGFILYIIMWAIMPEAVTAGDRLAMKGEKIDVNNIAKNIEAGVENLSETLQGFGEGIRNKKKRKKETTGNARNAAPPRFSVLDDDMFGYSDHPRSKSPIRKAVKGTFIFLVIFILLALFFGWLALIGASLAAGHVTSFLLPWDGPTSYSLALPLLLVFSIPIFSIARRIIRSIRPGDEYRTQRFKWIPGILTFMGVAAIFAILSFTGKHFKHQETVKSELLSFDTPQAPVYIDLDDSRKRNQIIRTDLFSVGKNQITINQIDLNVTKSPDKQWHLISVIKSRGQDPAECEKAANEIELEYALNDNTLVIGNGYSLNRGSKFRAQDVNLELQVPEGGQIDFDQPSLRKVPCEAFPEHDLHKELAGKMFVMGEEKLVEVVVPSVIGDGN